MIFKLYARQLYNKIKFSNLNYSAGASINVVKINS